MSATPRQRVVVTGVGATTPLGGDVPSTWEALLAGRSGARTLPYAWVAEYDLPVQFGAILAEPAADRPHQGGDQASGPVRAVRRARRA